LSLRALKLLATIAGVYAAFAVGYYLSREWAVVRLDTVKAAYGHDEFVEIRLRSRDPVLRERWLQSPPRARVLRGDAAMETIGGLREAVLGWDEGRSAWVGRWPCPWNAQPGEYRVELATEIPKQKALRIRAFRIERRRPAPLPARFAVMTWESARPLATLSVRAPDGQMKDWRGLLDWTEYVGADAFWMLGGQTPGFVDDEVWVQHNLAMVPQVARECHRRGLKFGVWAMCYLTMSSKHRLPGYEYALEFEGDKPKLTRAISLRDRKRPRDVASLLRRFAAVADVDFLGLDYIRNALGGYELADDFKAEMPGVKWPADWNRLSREQRMAELAKRKIARKDAAFIDAWQWWRAHRAAEAVREIRRQIGGAKPLWAFTLTWDRGWHHGQDPVMFNDAGADAEALMMYEADERQFAQILKDWHSYVRTRDAQLMVGDIVDWPLHQMSPQGPKEMARRLDAAARGVYADGPAAGMFVHDLDRALNGRLGPYSTRAWMDGARAAIRRFKGPSAPDPLARRT